MHLILLSDIFGHTDALSHFADQLQRGLATRQVTASAVILNPYSGVIVGDIPSFSDEAEAYSYFIEHSSVERYSQILATYIEGWIKAPTYQINSELCIIGFSVGASALWAYAATKKDLVISGVGYYSSQIRKMTHLSPQFPLELVFPEQEPHFSVSDTINKICTSPNVDCRVVHGSHGFMNKHSDNFDDELLAIETNQLINRLVENYQR